MYTCVNRNCVTDQMFMCTVSFRVQHPFVLKQNAAVISVRHFITELFLFYYYYREIVWAFQHLQKFLFSPVCLKLLSQTTLGDRNILCHVEHGLYKYSTTPGGSSVWYGCPSSPIPVNTSWCANVNTSLIIGFSCGTSLMHLTSKTFQKCVTTRQWCLSVICHSI